MNEKDKILRGSGCIQKHPRAPVDKNQWMDTFLRRGYDPGFFRVERKTDSS